MRITNEIHKFDAGPGDSSRARLDAVGTIFQGTHRMLREFRVGQKAVSLEQTRVLAEFMTGLNRDVDRMIRGFQKEHVEMAAALRSGLKKNTDLIETDVKEKLRGFSAAHAEMSESLKRNLAKSVAEIAQGTRELLGAFHAQRGGTAAAGRHPITREAEGRRIPPAGGRTAEPAVPKAASRKRKPKSRKK